jgi:hypothetical protein
VWPRDLTILGLYTGVALAWVYGALNWSGGLSRESGNDRMVWATIVVLGVTHLAVGYFGRGVWLLAVPAVLVLLAVPAGYFPTSRPEMPIWFGLAMLAPIFVVSVGIGMLTRRLGRRAEPSTSLGGQTP